MIPGTLDLRDRVGELAGDLHKRGRDRLEVDRSATPDERRADAVTGRELLTELNRLEQLDPDAIERLAPHRQMAQDAIDLAEDKATAARLSQRERAALTDAGNAARFAEDHVENLKFVPGPGRLVWDGKRWRHDDDGAWVRAAITSAHLIPDEARQIEDKDKRDAIFKHATRSEHHARLTAMVKLAESEQSLIARVEELDADAFALNVLNGTLDTRTGERRTHRREDLITKLAPVEFDPAAKCPRWDDFLAEVVPDEEVRSYLQRAFGYSLTADTREQCLFLPEGSGANGKSTLLETGAALLGDYGRHVDPSTFMDGRGRGVRSDLARLRGARFVVGAEIERGSRFAESLVKQMTGGDKIVAAELYRGEFEFRPTFKVWLAANALPEIVGTDHAIWRRIRRIPFTHKVERPDKTLPQKLRKELPGILNWALAGCLAWQRDGLGVPESVRAATQEYRHSQDTVRLFIEEACLLSDDARVTPTVLRGAYDAFCKRRGLHAVDQRAFAVSLEGHGLRQAKSGSSRSWRGITVGGGT